MRCGTLVYTKAGLFALFGWLLWGDFCFHLMQTITPSIMPLVLRSEGAPNLLISLTISTIPALLNFVMNPIISTYSDRFRSKGGRRIPFLRWATPFVTISLILIGFSQNIGRMLHGVLVHWFPDLPASVMVLGTISILMTSFVFFDLFIGTVFWYLFNDVVPTAFMGRFLGFFRVVGSLAGSLFSFFLFQYAESHTSILFTSVAILYGVAFMFMTWKVKEGEYPPPDPVERTGPIAWIRLFFSQCLSHKIYRLIFLWSAVGAFGGSIGMFGIFMSQSIGLTLDQIGKVGGSAGFVGMFLMYPMGALVDRFHPLRVMLVGKICYCVTTSIGLVFLVWDFTPQTALLIFAGSVALAIPIGAATTAAGLPMVMQLFPKDHFGQFNAANAMAGCVGGIVGGLAAGAFLDFLKGFYPDGSLFYYRFIPVWQLFFMLIALGAMLLVLREWKRLGGDASYTPPETFKRKDV